MPLLLAGRAAESLSDTIVFMEGEPSRTIIVSADRQPCPVVFEMLGQVVDIPPHGHLRLVVQGPGTAALTIGHGENGVSIFRDEDLLVEVYDSAGTMLDIAGW